MNKKAVVTWLEIILQIVTVFFGLGVVTSYINSMVMSGWMGVKDRTDVSYCAVLLNNLKSDIYLREGHSINYLDASMKKFAEDNYKFFDVNEPLSEKSLSLRRYSTNGINIGTTTLAPERKLVIVVYPVEKESEFREVVRGATSCSSYIFSPLKILGLMEVSYV